MKAKIMIKNWVQKGFICGIIVLMLTTTIISIKGEKNKDFVEECDSFDTSKWSYTWNPPTQGNGVWIWDFPAGDRKNIQCVRKEQTGYGTYKIKMKISGRVPGINYSPFLYDGTTKNEIDFIEIYGSNIPPHSPANQMSLSSYQYPQPPGSKNYEFWTNPFNWEDNNWHDFEFIYSKDKVIIKIDGIVSHTVTEELRYGVAHAPWIALPPMQLIIYAGSDGSNANPWQIQVDRIEYIEEVQTTEPGRMTDEVNSNKEITDFKIGKLKEMDTYELPSTSTDIVTNGNFIDAHILKAYEVKKAFIFGKFAHLTKQGGYFTIEAINLRVIFDKPFQILHYMNREKVTYDATKVLISPRFIIGIADVVI